MSTTEREIVCHDAAGKPCARVSEAEACQLAAAGKGRLVRSRRGAIVRLLLSESRSCVGWRGGSRTQTQRIRNERGEQIAPDFHIEFKPLVFASPQG